MTPAARSVAAWTLVAIQFALLAVLVVVPPGSLWVRDGAQALFQRPLTNTLKISLPTRSRASARH